VVLAWCWRAAVLLRVVARFCVLLRASACCCALLRVVTCCLLHCFACGVVVMVHFCVAVTVVHFCGLSIYNTLYLLLCAACVVRGAWCVAWCVVRGALRGAWCVVRCVVRGAWCVVRGALRTNLPSQHQQSTHCEWALFPSPICNLHSIERYSAFHLNGGVLIQARYLQGFSATTVEG
jgi:hypothetical protein